MTDYVEAASGRSSRYHEYIQRRGKGGCEVEHIWADHAERRADKFAQPSDFAEYRNRVGDLLILPKRFNASYGYKPYVDKREHYYGQNLLAQSLREYAYQHDPGYRRFIEKSGLPFCAHAEFRKAKLDARQDLNRQIAEEICNPDWLMQEAEE